jgi:hypothetical protein
MREADFPELTKRTLAQRVGYRCSNPDCRALTSGPQVDPSKSLNIGVAAHISAASPGGPRYNPTLSPGTRQDITNGIWLCQDCAKVVDNDPHRFTLTVLQTWKGTAEAEALDLIGKTARVGEELATTGTQHYLRFQEDLELESNSRFGFSFLYPKNWDRQDPHGSDGNIYTHPKDSRIEVRAWGGYAAVYPTLDRWVSSTIDIEGEKPGFQILRNIESGQHVDYERQTEKGPVKARDQIAGRRIVYEYNEGSEEFTATQVFTQLAGTQFAIRCQAPSGSYPAYEDLFIVLGQSLRVAGEHPSARIESRQSVVLCPRCGSRPGTPNACRGGREHSFAQFSGPVSLLYCPRCGTRPGTPNACLGGREHSFAQFAGPANLLYCLQCGNQPGTPNACLGGGDHLFWQFQGPKAQIYCQRCGNQPGTPNACLGGKLHAFTQY